MEALQASLVFSTTAKRHLPSHNQLGVSTNVAQHHMRISILPTFLAAKIDCKKSLVLCKKSIIKIFEERWANQYSLEQICWLLLGGIDEEYFVTCRDHGVRTEDGKC